MDIKWYEHAQCKGDQDPHRWFDTHLPQNVLDLRDICALCPVRNGCGKAAMEEEKGRNTDQGRWGFRAFMTPEDRTRIARKGGLRGQDPMKVVLAMEKARKKKV